MSVPPPPPHHHHHHHHHQSAVANFISIDRRDVSALQSKLFHSPPGSSMKISYEINTYKKVSASGFYIIPRGKKCIVWLTLYKGAQEAIFFDVDPRDHSKIKFVSIRAIHPSQQFHFDDFQGSGTVLYGTLFNHGPDQQQFFAVENIHVYENACVDHLNVVQKDELLYTLFSKSGLSSSTRAVNAPAHVQVVFGVAVKCGTYAEALKVANTPSIVPYSVYAIQGRFHTQTDNKYYQNCQSQGGDKHQGGDKNPLRSASEPLCGGGDKRPLKPLYSDSNTFPQGGGKLFMVSPQPLVDTYTLRCPISNVVEPEPAHVGDYKTSVLLNSIFRTVRENASLDAAEESEDEEVFQASQQMHIEGYISSSSAPERAMICTYNYKFKRWVPLRLGPNQN
jgi:hypothetical protein